MYCQVPNHSHMGREVVIPFAMSIVPMTKLAIINFEKRPDEVYRGLELQRLDGGAYGSGYRVIAYRRDGFVDVYDQPTLKRVPEEDFAVTGKGLCDHITTYVAGAKLATSPKGVHVSFSFVDKAGRVIAVDIEDVAESKTRGMNLLAPIGSSAESPTYLPLFFLEGFDFVRKSSKKTSVTIGGRQILQDDFPVPLPKDMQWRYYSRYAAQCRIIELARAEKTNLQRHSLTDNGLLVLGDLTYAFGNDLSLKQMSLSANGFSARATFTEGIPALLGLQEGDFASGDFEVEGNVETGCVSGRYKVSRDGSLATIEMTPSGGWQPRPNSLLTRMMFSPKSVFCSWPKTYRFTQNINLQNLDSDSRWERIRP